MTALRTTYLCSHMHKYNMHIYNIHMYTIHIHRSKEFDEDSKKINICMNIRVHVIYMYSYMCIHTHT